MKYFRFTFFTTVLILSSLVNANYLDRDEVQNFVDYLSEKHDFKKSYLLDIFSKTEKQQKIIDLMNNPSEKVTPWDDYKKRVSLTRVQSGIRFLNTYEQWFDKAEEVYGVPREVITSIIGLETNYGGYKGRTRVIDALTTAAFDYPRRRDFFKIQLEEYFLLTREEGFDPLEIKGSYAGAMGFVQFMPDNYRKLAIDFDGDGKKDILSNPADAIGSVANFLSSNLGNKKGWDRDGFIAIQASPKGYKKNIKSSFKLKSFKELDIEIDSELNASKKYIQISLFPKDDTKEEYWIGDKNLYAITRYNPSSKYAMSVFLLSREFINIGN
jgi:membrane-bound lytic murein transglycosylase B